MSQSRSIDSTSRRRSALGIAASALAAERLLLSDQHPQRAALLASREACGYAHLNPVENRVGRVLQGCHAAAQILDVVEGVLDGLANDVGEAGRAQPGAYGGSGGNRSGALRDWFAFAMLPTPGVVWVGFRRSSARSGSASPATPPSTPPAAGPSGDGHRVDPCGARRKQALVGGRRLLLDRFCREAAHEFHGVAVSLNHQIWDPLKGWMLLS